MRKLFALFLVLVPFLGYAAKWDVQYWQQLEWKNLECGRFKLYTLGETRLTHDLRRFTYYKLSEGLAYKALEDLDLEVHYSYINFKGVAANHFANRNRIELEANPTIKLPCGVDLKWRNRLEFIKEQDVLHIKYVCRQRLTLVFPIKRKGRLKAIKIADEVIYDLSRKRFTQNRFYPLELSFDLSKGVNLELYLLQRTLYSSGKWFRQVALGTNLSF